MLISYVVKVFNKLVKDVMCFISIKIDFKIIINFFNTIFFSDMYFLPSLNHGSYVLIYQDYKFWLNNRLKDKLSWACSYRKRLNCNCRVLTLKDGNFLGVQGEHNHPPKNKYHPSPGNKKKIAE